MNAHWPEPDRRELFVAGAAGIIWTLLGVALLAQGAELGYETSSPLPLEGMGAASSGDPKSPERSWYPSRSDREGVEAGTRSTSITASCRITNHLPTGVANIGSGTLIDLSADGQRGLVLTCAHLFAEGTVRVIVAFPGTPTRGANLLAIDRNADLAALEIARPPMAPSPIALAIDPAAQLTACGFGPNGQFRTITGPIVGASQGQGQMSIRLKGAVRSGDSGGGVFDFSGRLVAVVWGEAGGETYASSGAPLRSFLELIAGRSAQGGEQTGRQPPTTLAACPSGRCPLAGPGTLCPSPSAPSAQVTRPFQGGKLFDNVAGVPVASIPSQPPATVPGHGACNCGCDKDFAALAARLDALDRAKQDRGEYLGSSALEGYARSDQISQLATEGRARHESLVARLDALGPLLATAGQVAGPIAITALGISGPAGWGILAAATAGSWLLGRRLRRRGEQRGASSATKLASGPSLAPHSSPLAPQQEATAAADGAFQERAASHAGAASYVATTHIETRAPIDRDDREARELLRLSQLEGRDPLQDALAGRLALDRLDAIAESDVDPGRARLADDLRRELRERFNEIAPTKFQM